MLAAMLVIGDWITGRIEAAVVSNTASAGALYLESFVSPLSQELAANDRLSEPATRALDEVFASTGLGQRIVSFKIWKPGGLVAHASDPALIGQRFERKPELEAAWSGEVTGSFDDLDDAENAAEAAMGVPLLEIYSPLHEVWSGRIIAVAEFYEVAAELEQDLADARRTSWLLVAGTFLASGLMLLGIVRAGSSTIARQKAMLEAQIGESRERRRAERRAAPARHRRLRPRHGPGRAQPAPGQRRPARRTRAVRGARRHAARQPGSRHRGGQARGDSARRGVADGAQRDPGAVARALAARARPAEPRRGRAPRRRRASASRRAAGRARPTAARRTRRSTRARGSASTVSCRRRSRTPRATRPGTDVGVEVAVGDDRLTATVTDRGPGFDPAAVGTRDRAAAGWVSPGLRDRAESLGGELRVDSAPGRGTRLTLTLMLGKGTTQ